MESFTLHYTSQGPMNSRTSPQVQIPQHTALLSDSTALVTPNKTILLHQSDGNREGMIKIRPENNDDVDDDDDELLFDIEEFLEEEESLIHRSSSTISDETETEGTIILAESPIGIKDTGSRSSTVPARESNGDNAENPNPVTVRKKKRKKQRSRRSKNSLDADAPKRPLSAYNLYFREERKRCLAETNSKSSPERKKYNFEELGKLIGKGWRVLPLKEKQVLEARAEADRERYRNEMVAYRREKRRKLLEEDEDTLILMRQQQQTLHHPLSIPAQTTQGRLTQAFQLHPEQQPQRYSPKRSADHNPMVRPNITDSPGQLVYPVQQQQRRYPRDESYVYHEDSTTTAADVTSKNQHVRKVSVSVMNTSYSGVDKEYRSGNNASPLVSSYGSCSSWSGGEYMDDSNNPRDRKHKYQKYEGKKGGRKRRDCAGSETHSARTTPMFSNTNNTVLQTKTVENPQTPSIALPSVDAGSGPQNSTHASPHGVAVARVVTMLQNGRPLTPRSPHPQIQHLTHQIPPPPPSPQHAWTSNPHTQYAYGPPPPHYPQPYAPPPSSPLAADRHAYVLTPPPRPSSEAFAPPPHTPHPPATPHHAPPPHTTPHSPVGSPAQHHLLGPPQMLPMGMQIILRDPITGRERPYRVQYTPKYMTADQANEFQRSNCGTSAASQPQQQIPHQHVRLAMG
mmetsp:Transcript_154/g.399  ORF Transcript_154/g.399 Transcript_154/m.399 type:complete len:682 (+) Transcript_154:130-2175(+)